MQYSVNFIFIDQQPSVRFDDIMPLPNPEPPKRTITRAKPPNSIYTSPETLHYIKEKDKDSHIDFDVDEPENKKLQWSPSQ